MSSQGRWVLMAATICWLAVWACMVSFVAVGWGGVGGFLVRGVLFLCVCSVSLSVLAVWMSSSMSWAASTRCSVDALMGSLTPRGSLDVVLKKTFLIKQNRYVRYAGPRKRAFWHLIMYIQSSIDLYVHYVNRCSFYRMGNSK